MYASHLAINHFAGRGQIRLIQKPYLIDYSCTTNTSFQHEEIIHIHAWHVCFFSFSLSLRIDLSLVLDRRDVLEVSVQEWFVRSSLQQSIDVDEQLLLGFSPLYLFEISRHDSERSERRTFKVNSEHWRSSPSSSIDLGFSMNIVR